MAKSEKAEKATEGAKKMGAWAKFMHWYESYQGKRIVGVVYSIGASVVIVGALFKIMHCPGASIVLVSGMITEAFLFLIGALDKPHPEFNWSNVFPRLLEFGTDPAILEKKAAQARPTLLGAGVEGGEIPVIGGGAAVTSTGVQTPTAVSAAHVPALSEKDLESLQNGIADLAKTATQLSELGKVATATTQLTTKMEAAGTAAEQFAASQNGLLSVSNQLSEAYKAAETHMQGAADTTKMFAANMQNVGAQLSTLNSIYELQLNALNEQVEISKPTRQRRRRAKRHTLQAARNWRHKWLT